MKGLKSHKKKISNNATNISIKYNWKYYIFTLVCLHFFLVSFTQNEVSEIINVKQPDRIHVLYSWYHRKVRQYDSINAYKAFQQLYNLGLTNNDKTILAAEAFYKGQYQAVKQKQKMLGESNMQRGISLAESQNNEMEAAIYRHHLGFYYFFEGEKYGIALKEMIRANYTFRKIGYPNIKEFAYHLYQLAFVYYHLRNYHESLAHLKTALQYPIYRPIIEIYILNTAGQCYRNLNQFDSSLYYFNKTNQKAKKDKDTAWQGISAGNIGSVYIMQGNYTKAKPFVETYYELSLLAKDKSCISEALTALADIELYQGNKLKSLQQLQEAENIFKEKFQDPKTPTIPTEDYIRLEYLYNTFSLAYEAVNNTSTALQYKKMASKVSDSLERRAKLSDNEYIRQQLEAEQHANEILLLEKQKQNSLQKLYFAIACSLLLFIIFFLAYNRQKLKRKKDKEISERRQAFLESEQKRSIAELNHAQQLLSNYTDHLRQKTDMLEQLQAEVEVIKKVNDNDLTSHLEFLNTLTQSTILTENDWTEFRELFDKAYSGFFIKLKDKYDNLTPAETRLMALTKLKLSNKEMASMLGVGIDAIKKTKQRVKKKIDIPENMDIESLVESL